MTEPTDAEREQFEQMMRRDTFDDLSRVSDGSYKSYEARVGWIAWQAARRTPAPVGVEPVAWSTGITWNPDPRCQSEIVLKLTRRAQPLYGYTIPLYTADQVLAMGRVQLPKADLDKKAKVGAIHAERGGNVVLPSAAYRADLESRFIKGWREAERHHGIKEGGQHG